MKNFFKKNTENEKEKEIDRRKSIFGNLKDFKNILGSKQVKNTN